MPRASSVRRSVVAIAAAAAALLLSTQPAAAAPRPSVKSSSHGAGGSTGGASSTGYDVSYPQCGTTLPTGQAFAVVGVNGGTATKDNPCLAEQLAWAQASSGQSAPGSVPKAGLYVNTADPGDLSLPDWPTSSVTNDPYGACTTTTSGAGENSPACAWQYGWDRASDDVTRLNGVGGTAGDYPWWLDVETANSWESGTAGLVNNLAVLQGMVDAFHHAGVTTVGVYSTSYQWGQIVGSPTDLGDVAGIPVWLPGARTRKGAQSACSSASFTNGKVLLTQWVGSGLDQDYACA